MNQLKRFFYIFVLAMWGGLSIQAQDCSELFFSEYLEGTGNDKGMEIYNPTEETIALDDYWLARYSNGNNTFTSGGITQLEGFIQPYSTHLIVNGQTTSTDISPAASPELQAIANQLDHEYPAPTYMNGNDAIALFRDDGGSGDPLDFVLVDLFGIIGGGMTSSDEGWAAFTDEWVYKNIYDGDEVVDQDSVYITNYIVPDGYWWIPWTSNHALVRKPGVKKGITTETMPTTEFVVTEQWDTVPGGADVWDSLNAHYCDCEFATAVENDLLERGVSVYPNPAGGAVYVAAEEELHEVVLFDPAGRMVFTDRSLEGIREKQYDFSSLTRGWYVLKVRTAGGVVSEKLLLE